MSKITNKEVSFGHVLNACGEKREDEKREAEKREAEKPGSWEDRKIGNTSRSATHSFLEKRNSR